MVSTGPGETLLIGCRPVRNWTQLQFRPRPTGGAYSAPQAPWLFRVLFLKGGREFVLRLGRKKRKVGAYDQHQTPNTMHKLTLAIQRKQICQRLCLPVDCLFFCSRFTQLLLVHDRGRSWKPGVSLAVRFACRTGTIVRYHRIHGFYPPTSTLGYFVYRADSLSVCAYRRRCTTVK